MSGYIRNASEQAAKAVGYHPYDLNVAGVGSATFTPNGVDVQASPNVLGKSQLLEQLTTGQGQQALALQPQVTQFGQAATKTGTDLLQQAAGFDPLSAAEQRYQNLRAALQPDRAKEQAALQEQLFRQGRGSSGFAADAMGAQQRAYSQADAALLDRAFTEAQQAKNQSIQTGLQAGAAGTTVGQSGFQQALSGVNAGVDLAKQPLGLALVGQQLGAGQTDAELARIRAISAHNSSGAAGDSGGGLASSLGGIAGAALGGYFTGGSAAGINAGATLGSNLGSFL